MESNIAILHSMKEKKKIIRRKSSRMISPTSIINFLLLYFITTGGNFFIIGCYGFSTSTTITSLQRKINRSSSVNNNHYLVRSGNKNSMIIRSDNNNNRALRNTNNNNDGNTNNNNNNNSPSFNPRNDIDASTLNRRSFFTTDGDDTFAVFSAKNTKGVVVYWQTVDKKDPYAPIRMVMNERRMRDIEFFGSGGDCSLVGRKFALRLFRCFHFIRNIVLGYGWLFDEDDDEMMIDDDDDFDNNGNIDTNGKVSSFNNDNSSSIKKKRLSPLRSLLSLSLSALGYYYLLPFLLNQRTASLKYFVRELLSGCWYGITKTPSMLFTTPAILTLILPLAFSSLPNIIPQKQKKQQLLTIDSPLVQNLSTLSLLVESMILIGNLILNLLQLIFIKIPVTFFWKVLQLGNNLSAQQRQEKKMNRMIFNPNNNALLMMMFNSLFLGPMEEEFIYRYTFHKVWNKLGTFFFNTNRNNNYGGRIMRNTAAATTTTGTITSPMVLMNSILFSLTHITSWFPISQEDIMFSSNNNNEQNTITTYNAWNNVMGALVNCVNAFLVARFVFNPLYIQRGLAAAISSHITLNILAEVIGTSE